MAPKRKGRPKKVSKSAKGKEEMEKPVNPSDKSVSAPVGGGPLESDTNATRSSHSVSEVGRRSSSNGGSVQVSTSSLRKRRLLLEAAEQKANLKRRMIEEREKVELELISDRLAAELAEETPPSMNESERNSLVTVDRLDSVGEWVERGLLHRKENEYLNDRNRQNYETNTLNEMGNISGVDAQISNAIIKTLEVVRESSKRGNDSQMLASRLTLAKELPKFSGDGLQWLQFKQAFEISSELGKYSDQENVSRLYSSLNGEAREAVDALMVSANSASSIMEALELRFGNPENIVQKVIQEIKKLPKIHSGKIDLVTFATKVRNVVAALQAIDQVGHLHSPELINEIITKLPHTLIHGYNHYISLNKSDEPKLIKLANYLYNEAKMACAAGTNKLQRNIQSGELVAQRRPITTTSKPRPILISTTDENDKSDREVRKSSDHNKQCYFCDKKGHYTSRCLGLKKLPNHERWKWAEKSKVCFKCLNVGHNKSNCWGRNCNIDECNKQHNRLLHRSKPTRKNENKANANEKGCQATEGQNTSNGNVNNEKRVL